MGTSEIARGLVAALQPLTGPAAKGQLLVRATGADVQLEPGRLAIPFPRGSLREDAAVFVRRNPATQDGAWTVTAAGTPVDVEAVLGGPVGNQPAGTEYRWDPALEGMEAVSSSSAPGVQGGAFHEAFATLRQVRRYKQLDRATAGKFFAAQVAQYPAACIAWESTTPLDGPMAAAPAPRAARVGSGRFLFRHTWLLWIITSRLDSDLARTREGDVLRDDLLSLLLDSRSARDKAFRLSVEPGIQILEARVFQVTPTSYVDLIRFATTAALQHCSSATYNDWLTTRLRLQTAEQAGSKLDVPDITIPMTE